MGLFKYTIMVIKFGFGQKMRNFHNKALRFLKQPFPYKTTRYSKPRAIITITVFVFLFMLIFQPFGLRYLGSDGLILRIAEYVAFIFLVLCFNILLLPMLFSDFFSDENWTIFKNIMFTLFNFAVVGFCSLFYAHVRGQVQLILGNFLHFEFYTVLIGGLPVAFLVLLNHVHILRQHLKTAEKLNKSLQLTSPGKGYSDLSDCRLITLTAENGKDMKTFDADSLVLFTSADNYAIIFTEHENRIKNELLRSSLTRIEEALKEHSEFFRCHRAYIINLRKIKAITGNSQGYKLIFDNLDEQIPVARSHVRKFNERMAALT